MVAQFQLMGVSAQATEEFVQKISDDARSMGLSSGKLIKNVLDNMDKINKLGLQGGVKALAKMTEYSQKLKVNMDGVFNAASKARTLEGALEMASNLLVLGGEFSNADPFKLAFLSREKPEEFTKSLVEMSGAVAQLNKRTGEFDISAYDFDRLSQAAEASGRNVEDLMQEAKQLERVKLLNKQIYIGNKEQKDLVASLATMQKDGSFEIQVGTSIKKVSDLQAKDLQLLQERNKSLEENAKLSQSFDESFTTFVNTLKATLLPVLIKANEVLNGIKGFMDKIPDSTKPLIAYGLIFAGAVPLLGTIFSGFKNTVGALGNFGSNIGNLAKNGGLFGKIPSKVGDILPDEPLASASKNQGKTIPEAISGPTSVRNTPKSVPTDIGANAAKTASNYSYAASIVAVGVAAVGVGFGIKLASEGIAKLAEAMKGMKLQEINGLLGVTAILLGGMVATIVAAGIFGNAALPGLLGIAAVLATIGAAGAGVGYLIDKLNEYNNPELKFAESVKGINFEPMRSAFREANEFLRADTSAFEAKLNKIRSAIQNLSEIKLFSNFDKLEAILNKGLEVKLADNQKMAITVDLKTNFDSKEYVTKYTKEINLKLMNAKRGVGNL